MNIGTPEEPIQVASDTPETDAALIDHMPKGASEWSQCYYELSVHARRMERERNAARIPICIGRPIIEILAKDGVWISVNGNSVIAADCLFRNNPYITVSSNDESKIRAWKVQNNDRPPVIVRTVSEEKAWIALFNQYRTDPGPVTIVRAPEFDWNSNLLPGDVYSLEHAEAGNKKPTSPAPYLPASERHSD